MSGLKRFAYLSMVSALRCYTRACLDMRVIGRGNIPAGPKIYAVNHVTSTDPYWMLTVFREPVHILIGPGYQSPVAARFFDYFEQINTMPAHRKFAAAKAASYLRRGGAIYTAPEGDIQTDQVLGRFYPGVAKIYRRCPAPIIPIAVCTRPQDMRAYPRLDMEVEGRVYRGVFVLRGVYVVNVGMPFLPQVIKTDDEKADNRRIMDELKRRIGNLLDEAKAIAALPRAEYRRHCRG